MDGQVGLGQGRGVYNAVGGSRLSPTRLVLVTPGHSSVPPILPPPFDHPAGPAVLATLLSLVAIESAWFALLYHLITAL
jgi:hypothetical protein